MAPVLAVLVGLAVAALLVAVARAGRGAGPHHEDAGLQDAGLQDAGLQDVVRTTRRWQLAGLVLGAGLAAAVAGTGRLGLGALLATPLAAAGVLAGVLLGELRVPAPAGPHRRAVLEVRRARDRVPVVLAAAVATAAVLLAVLLTATTAVASPDDLGRPGRWLVHRCGASSVQASGPFPGSWYSVPLAVAVGACLLLAATAVHRLVLRPRSTAPGPVDDAVRRRVGTVVTAAVGLAVAVPLAAVAVLSAAAVHGVTCRPASWALAGWSLLALVPACGVLAARCLSVLLPSLLALPRRPADRAGA